ncbi:MAG: 4'-phosphopantetheinyl transferase superfamily protein [Pseudohongiellaceae bacterium]
MGRVGDMPRLHLPGTIAEGLRSGVEAHVWLIDARESDLSRLTGWAAGLLGGDEQQRASAIVSGGVRRDHLAGRVALRLLLSAYCPGVPPRAWVLSRAPGGRPLVSAPRSGTLKVPSFSISHSEGYLALSLYADGETGVDIEPVSRDVDARGLARRYFSAAELERLEALTGEALRAGFLRTWTLKEASVKADGAGLAGELARRAFGWTRAGRILTDSPDGRCWQYWSWRWRSEQMLALALRHPAGWSGRPVICRPFTLSLSDGGTAEAVVTDGYESAVV